MSAMVVDRVQVGSRSLGVPVSRDSVRRGGARRGGRGEGAAAAARDGSGLSGLRLTRRGRLVIFVLATLVAAAVVFGGARAFAGAEAVAPVTQVHTVVTGDTLWAIAKELTAPGGDVRTTVREIAKLNSLGSEPLLPGDRLVVPVLG